MRLKELLETVKKTDNEFITVWYKNPKDKYNSIIKGNNIKEYLEVDVNSYKKFNSECIDPISGTKTPCVQHSIELDWDEVRIIKEAKRQNQKIKGIKKNE